MKVARYIGNGQVQIVDEEPPAAPEGGLLIETEASGLCSGELMDWYMDRKIPHVLGHEVAGRVTMSHDARYPVGSRVFAHHHAPCMKCDQCRRGLYVHCPQWKATKLMPGGMAEVFAVSKENLTDAIVVDDLRPIDAALIEPLGCVVKSIRKSDIGRGHQASAVVGLGFMGLMHMLLLPAGTVGFDVNAARVEWARSLGLDVRAPDSESQTPSAFDRVFVCPGSQAAFDLALSMVRPEGTIVMFAPLPPGEDLRVPQSAYFNDIRIAHAYSCGPDDTAAAANALRRGAVKAEQVVSDFIAMDDLPSAYQAMKKGAILKPMVVF